ncbi:ABC transporter permease [Patescibacteria group bacterium]|nr:ABC transporter permease [Patescibacteria group bacterium]
MKFSDIMRMAIGNLRRNKMRTLLTVAGVVVGIGAIVFLVSLGFGLQNLLINQVANLEALTVITVRPGSQEDKTISADVVERFKSFGEAVAVSPKLSYPAQITLDEANSETIVTGVEPEHFGFEDIKVDYGDGSLASADNAAIVSVASLKALNLTNPDEVIGKELDFKIIQVDEAGNIKKDTDDIVTFKIVGMTAEDKIKYAYVPLKIIKDLDGEQYSEVKVKVAERNQVANVRKTIESMGFPTTSIKDTVDQIDQAFVIVKSVLFSFGFIALFVAAIGIFNTMTISLLERTHEIGIMKAIGGRNKDVSRVFTAEAAMIGLMGGLSGVAAGWVLGFLLNGLVNFIATSVGGEANNYFSTPIVDFAIPVIGFSFVVSTFAGIWPAKRAAKLNPLEALRYE